MKIGIKCEIHSCTIEVMKRLLNKFFSFEEISLLQTSLTARIDSQYYTDRFVKEEQRRKMVESASAFHLKCRDVSIKLTSSEINNIRKYISGT